MLCYVLSQYPSYLPVELSDPDGKVELVPESVQGVLRLPQVDRVGPQVTLVILGYGDFYTTQFHILHTLM